MSNGDRWLPLYVADYLGDTMHLTGAEHGAYLLLLMHYWRNGPLPDDDLKLARIARTDSVLWKTVGPVIREFFTVNGDGTLHQKRMDWELRRWGEISGKRRDAGRRGAEAKHRTHPNGGGGPLTQPGKTLANAKQMPQQLPEPQPVDNLAIATNLPPGTLANAGQMPAVCHDFASPPVQVQREDISLSLEKKCARESKPPETGQDLPRETDHLELVLRESLQIAEAAHKASVISQQRRQRPEAPVNPIRRPKACPLAAPYLAAMRKQAGITVAA